MPSIPQSLRWISLVVLWLFVLVPMLINKREAVRRTSDVALATRVLTSGASARKLRRGRSGAGHHGDPTWQAPDDAHDEDDEDDDEMGVAGDGLAAGDRPQPIVLATRTTVAAAEPDYLDVDVVEEHPARRGVAELSAAAPEAIDTGAIDTGAIDTGAADTGAIDTGADDTGASPTADTETIEVAAADDAETAAEAVGRAGETDDTPALDDTALADDDEPVPAAGASQRRFPHESRAVAAVTARKYRFRRRMVAALTVLLVASVTAALTVWPDGWWLCATLGVVTALYLGYLRRQTRIEEQLRARRAQRLARSRAVGVHNTADRGAGDVGARLRRPGAVVLEIDDEDPAFEHLQNVTSPIRYDLLHASGQ